jgi:hypothetical protein
MAHWAQYQHNKVNTYATNKTVAKAFLNTSLLSSNMTVLITIRNIASPSINHHQWPQGRPEGEGGGGPEGEGERRAPQGGGGGGGEEEERRLQGAEVAIEIQGPAVEEARPHPGAAPPGAAPPGGAPQQVARSISCWNWWWNSVSLLLALLILIVNICLTIIASSGSNSV